MVLLCSNCHSTPASTCSNCIDKNLLSPYQKSINDQTASHKRHARKAVALLDGEGGLEEVRVLESQIGEMERKVDELGGEEDRVREEAQRAQSLITQHLQTLPIRQHNLLQHPFQPSSSSFAPPPSNKANLWSIRQKRMLELLDVFDVRPADEDEGEEDEDWVIGGGLVVPSGREELNALPPEQTSSSLVHTLHLLQHLSSLSSCPLPNPPQLHPPALLPPLFLSSSSPSSSSHPTHSHTHHHSSSSSAQLQPPPALHPSTLLTSLAFLQNNVSHFSSYLGIPVPPFQASRVLANVVRAVEEGNGEPASLGVSLEEIMEQLGVGGDGAEGGKSGKSEKKREGETKEERRERRERERRRREEKKKKAAVGSGSGSGKRREKEKEGVEEWEVVDEVV